MPTSPSAAAAPPAPGLAARPGPFRATEGSVGRLDAETSDIIRVARVLCILFMMTVHTWPGGPRVIEASAGTTLGPVYSLIIDVLGRSSVPLLSYFSGILFFMTLASGRRRWAVVRDKALTLYWPMVFWSVPMIAILVAEDVIRFGAVDPSRTPLFWAGQLLGFGSGPANTPLHFFREIFVMCLYSVAVFGLARLSRPLAWAAFLAIAWFELRHGHSLMARDPVFIFFTAGMAMAWAGRAGWKPGWPLVAALLALYAAGRLGGIDEAVRGQHWLGVASGAFDRLAISLAMFLATILVVRRLPGLRQGAFWLEPRIFTVFCTHKLTISMFGGAAFFLGWSEFDPLYPLLLAGQIIACVVVGVLAMPLLDWIPHVTGRRRTPRRAATPLPA